VSLEGYINARLLHAALEKHGRDLTTESIITTLLTLSVDLGIGTQLRFSSERHQATDVVWGVRLDDDLTPKALDRSLTDMLEQ